jgi:predicted RNase H-like HicB family nuclease
MCLQTKSGNWVAVCDPLELTVQSETWAELMEDIGDTLEMLFQDLLSSNELERFLQDHGWEAVGHIPAQLDEPVRFDVPFSTTVMGESYV